MTAERCGTPTVLPSPPLSKCWRQAHFADPYQYWGEALLAKGDARGAIEKFEQAVKYAPMLGADTDSMGRGTKETRA